MVRVNYRIVSAMTDQRPDTIVTVKCKVKLTQGECIDEIYHPGKAAVENYVPGAVQLVKTDIQFSPEYMPIAIRVTLQSGDSIHMASDEVSPENYEFDVVVRHIFTNVPVAISSGATVCTETDPALIGPWLVREASNQRCRPLDLSTDVRLMDQRWKDLLGGKYS